jgi:hypothetical protein
MHLRYAQTRIPVSWRTESQIINSSYHKNSPDPMEGYWITHKHWMLLTPSQGESIVAVSSMEAEYIACYFGMQDIENGFANYSRI